MGVDPHGGAGPAPGSEADALMALRMHLADAVAAAGGWIGFDRFMDVALYAPGLGYYSRRNDQIGRMPAGGSDFVTAPELTPAFSATLAVQVAQALSATGTTEMWEFGAGTGALAAQLLQALDAAGRSDVRYTIVDVSGGLAARQRERLGPWAERVAWCVALPRSIEGVVVGNEVLDAMPVQLLARVAGQWHERGIAWQDGGPRWADRPTKLRPPYAVEGTHDYLTEIHPQAEAFVRTLGDRLTRGAAFLIDYGFPEAEYYHPQRSTGTVMCHRAHRADDDPLADVGAKDITAHVNFTGIALAAQEAGLDVLGYTSQGRFLLNCGLLSKTEQLSLTQSAQALHLVHEHEMGELFKVIALGRGLSWEPVGFAEGDRSHRL